MPTDTSLIALLAVILAAMLFVVAKRREAQRRQRQRRRRGRHRTHQQFWSMFMVRPRQKRLPGPPGEDG